MIRKISILTTLMLVIFINGQAQPKEKKVIMAVFAHPDDEAVSNVTPLLARYAREGNTVYLVIATKGEYGTNDHANIPAGEPLAKVRAGEAACACDRLRISPPLLLGLGDGALVKSFTGQPLREKLDSIFNLYKPDIVITWGPDGGYGHMDHRMVHNVVTELFQSGESLKAEQLFYAGIPYEYWKKQPVFKSPAKYMFDEWKPVKKQYLTTRITYTKQDFENAVLSMQCHTSQFSKEEMADIRLWMVNSPGDTVYLRPFIPQQKISYHLFRK